MFPPPIERIIDLFLVDDADEEIQGPSCYPPHSSLTCQGTDLLPKGTQLEVETCKCTHCYTVQSRMFRKLLVLSRRSFRTLSDTLYYIHVVQWRIQGCNRCKCTSLQKPRKKKFLSTVLLIYDGRW